MRSTTWAVIAVCSLLLTVAGLSLRDLDAQSPSRAIPHTSESKTLIALSSDGADHQLVTVIDPSSRVMSVYHVERATGVISLKSVRNIHADLMMDEFNTESPLPREIRAILTTR